jgi:peptidoglycan hydrolase CwlO-like protein
MSLEKKNMKQVRTNSSCLLKSITSHPLQTLLEFKLDQNIGRMHLHLMTFARAIHSQKKTIKTLDSIIACKRAEVSTLEDKIQNRKRKILELEDKEGRDGRMRKRAKLSDLIDDLDSQLEEATNNADYNQGRAHTVEEEIFDLNEEVSALKMMVSDWEDNMQIPCR